MDIEISQHEIGEYIHISAGFIYKEKQEEIWFEIPIEFKSYLTVSGDPFLIAFIFIAMEQGEVINLKNRSVSKELLRNINEFQRAWAAWKPHTYKVIQINATIEVAREPDDETETAICAFTGGVDGGFILHDNVLNQSNPYRHCIKALLYIHGFHIPIDNYTDSDSLFSSIKNVGDELQIKSIKIRSNLRSFGNWHDTHAAYIIACMALFQNQFNVAILGSSHPYQYLRFPWGSNPITDPLLTTRKLKVINYGGGYTRIEKLEKMIAWRSFHKQVNVCIRNYDKNCGSCEKCLRTMLGYIALNQPIPTTFPTHGLIWWKVLTILAYKNQEINDYRNLYAKASSNANSKKLLFTVLYFNIFLNRCLNKSLALFGQTNLPGGTQWRKLKRMFKQLQLH